MTQTVFYLLLATEKNLISEAQFESLSALPQEEQLDRLQSLVGSEHFQAIEAEVNENVGAQSSAIDPTVVCDHEAATAEGAERSKSHSLSTRTPIGGVPVGIPETIVTREDPGRYVVKKEQGRGAIGRVMLAFDEHIGRDVAIKELLLEKDTTLGDSESGTNWTQTKVERFLREARITGQLQHPSIIPVHEIGKREDGTFYYTMKLIKGKTLAQAIEEAEGIEQRTKLLPHFRDMCHAIAFAHSYGVVHRDIKPANVMIGQFGETVVLDWGLAKIHGQRDERIRDIEEGMRLLRGTDRGSTVDGSTLGTPAYMPPEQARGEIDAVDWQSDVYSLGACLYEILAGHPPYTGKSAYEIVKKVVSKPIIPLENADVPPPPELAAIATKALARDKSDRYSNATQLAQEIEAYMSGEKISGYQYTSWELLRRFVARHKVWFFAACVTLFVAVGAFVSISVALSNERGANEEMRKAVSQKMIALEKEELARRETNYHLAEGLNREADLLAQKKKFLSARVFAASSLVHNPATVNGPHASAEFAATHPRSVEIRAEAATKIYQARLQGFVSLQGVISTGDSLYGGAISRDGRRGAVAGKSGDIYLIDIASQKIINRLKGHSKLVVLLVFSSDGKRLASASFDTTVKIWDVSSGELLHTLRGHDRSLFSLDYSPSGRWIASGGGDSKIIVWDALTGERAYTLNGHTDRVLEVAFSPDGEELVSCGHDRKFIVWDLKKRRARLTLELGLGSLMSLVFTKDGRRIMVGSRSGKIAVLDAQDGHRIATLTGHEQLIEDLTVGRSGKLLASAAFDHTICFWDIENYRLLLKIDAHETTVPSVAFSDDEKTLISTGSSSEVKIWKVDHRRGLPVLEGHENSIWDLIFSPDGRQVATIGGDSTARIWDAETGRELHTLKGHTATTKSVAYSPDGRLLFTGSNDKTIKFWDPARGELLRSIPAHDGPVTGLVVTPDSKRLVSVGGDNWVKIWDVNTGTQLSAFKAHDDWIATLAMSPDGTKIATPCFDKTARIWDLDSGKQLKLFKSSDWVSGVAFSPDGKLLLTSGKDAKATIWNISTGKKIKEFIGHDAWVNNVAMNLDESLVATASDDATMRIWSVETAEPIIIWKTKESIAVAFSPDGTKVALGDRDVGIILPMEFGGLFSAPEQQFTQAKKLSGLDLVGFSLSQKN